jgi:hypothetical protein
MAQGSPQTLQRGRCCRWNATTQGFDRAKWDEQQQLYVLLPAGFEEDPDDFGLPPGDFDLPLELPSE